MLVLTMYTRPGGNKVYINGGEIVVTLLETRDNKVRIGFEADQSISIHREKIHNMIEERRHADDQKPG